MSGGVRSVLVVWLLAGSALLMAPAPVWVDGVSASDVRIERGEVVQQRREASRPYEEEVRLWAQVYELPPALVWAVIEAESGFRLRAKSSVGAVGLMQVRPDTARFFGLDPGQLEVAEVNVRAGCAYLDWLLRRYDGAVLPTLAAYNAGHHHITAARPLPSASSRRYSQRVLRAWARWSVRVGGGVVMQLPRTREGGRSGEVGR